MIKEFLTSFIFTLGLILVVHDVMYHLGLAPPWGREERIGGMRIHHGYIGAILIGLAVMLIFVFR